MSSLLFVSLESFCMNEEGNEEDYVIIINVSIVFTTASRHTRDTGGARPARLGHGQAER